MPFSKLGKDTDTTEMFSYRVDQSGGAADLGYQMLRRGEVGLRGNGWAGCGCGQLIGSLNI